MSRSASAAGPLLLRMFGGRSKRGRQGNLLQHAEHVLKSGYVQEPLWLDALRLCPPPTYFPGRRPPKIAYPEDKLIHAYYKRNPTARYSPMDLNSSEPTFVQRYAWRQLELMESEGLGAEQARVRVDAEVAAAGQRELARATAKPGQAIVEGPREWLAPPPVNKKSMGAVQEEEERVLAGVLGSRA